MVEHVGGPLAGKRIVITRRRVDAEELCARLAALGATPICAPVIDAVAIASPALDQALAHLIATQDDVTGNVILSASEESHVAPRTRGAVILSASEESGSPYRESRPMPPRTLSVAKCDKERCLLVSSMSASEEPHYSWLVFTSAPAVEFFFARIADLPFPVHLPPVAAVGPATAARLWSLAQVRALLPLEATGAQLGRALPLVPGDRVLLPRAQDADPEIGVLLRERGAVVEDIAIYTTTPSAPPPPALAEIALGIDMLTFTSPSTVQAFFDRVAPQQIGGALIVCIGPTTARAVQSRGLRVAAVARQASADGLIEALIELCETEGMTSDG